MGCLRLTYQETFTPLNVVYNDLNASDKCFVGDYRYGFNGMEKDDEIKGSGNSYDFGARLYDSRLGRWLTIDPQASKYPNLSPYNFVGNSPIIAIDPNGEEIIIINKKGEEIKYTPQMEIPNDADIYTQDVIMGLNYMYNNVESADKSIDLLDKDETQVKIKQSINNTFSPYHQKGEDGKLYHYLSYNNILAKQMENGEWQSPVVGLAHEINHASWYFEIVANLYENPDSEYWNDEYSKFIGREKEEKRASTDPESLEVKTAKSLNQGVRKSYSDPIDAEAVGCPTCTTPLEEDQLNEQQKSYEDRTKKAIKESQQEKTKTK